MRFRRRILISQLALSVLPVLAVTLGSLFVGRAMLDTYTAHSLSAIAQEKLKAIELSYLHARDASKLISSRTQLRISLNRYFSNGDDAELERAKRILDDAIAPSQFFNDITILSAEGEVVLHVFDKAHHHHQSAPITKPEAGVLAADMLKREVTATMIPSDPAHYYFLEELELGGELIGYALMRTEFDISILRLDYSSIGESGRVMLSIMMNEKEAGILRYNSGTKEVLVEILSRSKDADPRVLAVNGADGFIVDAYTIGKEKDPAYAIFRYFTPLRLGIVLEVDRADVLRPLNQFTLVLALFSACILLVSILLTINIINRVYLPIMWLLNAAKRMTTGEIPERMKGADSLDDEMKSLIDVFQHMCQQVYAKALTLRSEVSQKSAELNKLHRLFQDVIDNATAVIYVKDTDGKYLLVNQRFSSLFNPDKKNLIGMKDAEIFSEKTAKEFCKNDKRIVETGQLETLEEVVYHPDGQHTYISVKFPLRDDNGRIYAVAGISTDIEDQKRIEADLRESNEFLDSVIENIPNMIFVKDAEDLRFVRFNRAGEKILGYKKEELLGKNDYDLFPKEQADFFTKADRKVLSTDEITEIPEEEINTKKKGKRLLHTRKIRIKDRKGKPKYLLGISTDITDKKRASTEHEQIFTITGDLLCVFTSDWVFTDASPSFAETLGWDKDELLGKSLIDFINPLDIELSQKKMNMCHSDTEKCKKKFECRILAKDGSSRWISWNAVSIRKQNDIYAIGRDITEKKQVDIAKTDFIGIASHQLRTPLSVIRWSFDILMEKMDEFSDTQSRMLRNGHTALVKLVDSLNVMLMTTRLESNTYNLTKQPIQLLGVLETLKEEYLTQVEQNEQTLNVQCKDTVSINTDATVLREILANVISNALRYSPPKSKVDVQVTETADTVQVKVKDNGIGIPEKDKAHIFEKLFRAKNAMLKDTSGTGLGLYVVRQLTNIVGGTIEFESEEGKGTTFIVEFPKSDD